MLTPEELYLAYSNEPCAYDADGGALGAGSPYDLYKLSIFLKQLKFPCFDKDPSGINLLNTGSGQLSIPYKYLEILDPECFTEIQPTIEAGTAHAIRNAADISRACSLYTIATDISSSGKQILLQPEQIKQWGGRGATEYITFFGKNILSDCLFVLGPNIVSSGEAIYRGTGCGDLDCLPAWKTNQPKAGASALGAGFSCGQEENSQDKECTPCRKCDKDENGDPLAPEDPCCLAGSCEDKVNFCCGDPPGDREYFRYKNSLNFKYNNFFSSANFLPKDPLDEDNSIKHIGYLIRKSYGGYANFLENSDRLNTCPVDLFLKYMQSINGYNYNDNTEYGSPKIGRVKTISLIQNTETIKDLLYNGYGVVLLSNVGFSNKRDSKGLSYPDRIWYHSYAIIGCDDTRKEFKEAVYLLANSWGDWNSGGHPSWGPLPIGSFLVTESHLKAMLNLERIDKAGCRSRTNIDGQEEPGCVLNNSCSPWECSKYQKAIGYAFGLSFYNGFSRQYLDFQHFVRNWDIPNNPTEFIYQEMVEK